MSKTLNKENILPGIFNQFWIVRILQERYLTNLSRHKIHENTLHANTCYQHLTNLPFPKNSRYHMLSLTYFASFDTNSNDKHPLSDSIRTGVLCTMCRISQVETSDLAWQFWWVLNCLDNFWKPQLQLYVCFLWKSESWVM